MLGLKFYLEPLEGDLTRIGGYKESDYGWNKPQRVSPNQTVNYARDPNKNKTYYPVVVLGDSFSHFGGERKFGWQQLLADYSGLDSVTYNTNNVGVEAFIKSEHYNKQPPALLIYQFVERKLIDLTSRAPASCPAVQSPAIAPRPIVAAMKATDLELYGRPKGLVSLDEAMAYLRQNIGAKRKARINVLTREDLISNKRSGQLLWLNKDLKKFRLEDTDLEQVGCYLSYLQNSVQLNGITRFITMISPDKTTIYGRYLEKPPFEIRDMISPVDRPGLNLIRLDRDLSRAVENGIQDIYLPNDTHWGFAGSDLAAKSVIDFLIH